jgi:hypothetical protein
MGKLFEHSMLTIVYEVRYPTRTRSGLVGLFPVRSVDWIVRALADVVHQANAEREPSAPFGRDEYVEVVFSSVVPYVPGTLLVTPTWMASQDFVAALAGCS